MHYHFIAIGGAAMHNLAIALHLQGHTVSGSDDEIFDPARSRLQSYGLLPQQIGWDAQQISSQIDAVILGMHARANNPELLAAKALQLPIYSYPEFLFQHAKDKTRIVIGGSHGKTTITAMLLHVCKQLGIETDYMVGSQLAGYEVMVRLSDSAPIMILEGDEYLSSPLDKRPKFHLYQPHIALLSGIAWDHINVFPTFSIYLEQFRKFIALIRPEGHLIYCQDDQYLPLLAQESRTDIKKHPYQHPNYHIDSQQHQSVIEAEGKSYPMHVFGRHNMQNIAGAALVGKAMGISPADFYSAIGSFSGASNRLEALYSGADRAVYKDFAHSPSKLKATVSAMKEQFADRSLVACMELHTFSSLNANFLSEYKESMHKADTAIVYFNPHTIAHKGLQAIEPKQLLNAFSRPDLLIFTDKMELEKFLKAQEWPGKNLLLMSSGNFGGIDYKELTSYISAQ